MKLQLMAVVTGISAKSGKHYFRITVRGKRVDGSYVLSDFWLSEKVGNQLISEGIKEDDFISFEFDLDDNLHPNVVAIYKEES